MVQKNNIKKVIVILGPTAVGKSKLAVEMAKKIDGEIISADSMQVYRELNIGTAKILTEEMQSIPHYFLNIKTMFESYNVWQFVTECRKKIDDIIIRNKVPIIVGGTNLYITALIKNYQFENSSKNEKQYQSQYNLKYCIYALNYKDRSELYKKINDRVDEMINNGLIKEVETLKNKGLTTEFQAGKSIGYRELIEYFNKKQDLKTAIDKIKQHSRNFAKRQLTWLRNMRDITWLDVKNFDDNLKILIDVGRNNE